jgi:hypothetical protein
MLCALLYQQLLVYLFGFYGSHYNSSVGSVKFRLQNVKSQYLYAYWKVLTPELLKLGIFSSNAEVTGIFGERTPY